jgi:hypothetical protein
VTNWNAGAERIKGYKSREIVGKHFSVSRARNGRAARLLRRPDATIEVADFLLLHGNHVEGPQRIRQMVHQCRARASYCEQPVLFNEDDHFDFDANDNHMLAATGAYAGWGYFDYRMADEGHDEGYQSMPVNWAISAARKRGCFKLLAGVTGATPPSSQGGICSSSMSVR